MPYKTCHHQRQLRHVGLNVIIIVSNIKINIILEKMAIANALQLDAAQASPVRSRFYYDTMPSLKSLNLL